MATIAQLAVSRRGEHLAAADFARTVHVWDLRTLRPVRVLDTLLDFGGRRLAVSDDGGMVVAAAWDAAVAAYAVRDGAELWRRADLARVQVVEFDARGTTVLCELHERDAQELEARTGRTVAALPGVRRVRESPFGGARFVERAEGYALGDPAAPLRPIEPMSIAVLAVAFSATQACVTEAGGPVRAFDLVTARELWRHTPEAEHFINLGHRAEAGGFFGVSVADRGEPVGLQVRLQRFDGAGGASTVTELPALFTNQTVVCLDGSRVVTLDGGMYDTASGERTATLPLADAGLSGGAP